MATTIQPIVPQIPADQLANALARYREGFDPALIELPEAAVFPHLIAAQPSTARKARVTGVLLGRPAPRFVKRGRSVRYRLRSEEHTSELQSRPHLVCRL